jgi:hypothetical protein
MARRDLTALLALAALATALALVQGVTGVGADVLIAAPGLLLLLPLAAGRYVGEERLARLARPTAPPRRGHRTTPGAGRRARRAVPRGGLLIAVALARRGPPGNLLAC